MLINNRHLMTVMMPVTTMKNLSHSAQNKSSKREINMVKMLTKKSPRPQSLRRLSKARKMMRSS